MQIADLIHLIAQGESALLELKKSTAEKDRACRSLCAFANADGGTVVFGVTPAGKLVGQCVTDRTLEELAHEFTQFEPPLLPIVQRLTVAQASSISPALEALVVQVSRISHAPVSYKGVPYDRVLNTTRVMPRSRYQSIMLEAMHGAVRWENQAATGWQVSDLDHTEMVLTLDEAVRRGRLADPGTRDALNILKGLGLLLKDNQLSRASLALFAKGDAPLPDYPQFKLRLARFKGSNKDEFLDNRQYFGNAFSLMQRAERFLLDWLPIASKIMPTQLTRVDTPALPIEALREALANAFIHRDYAMSAGSVAIALYDNCLDISSSGALPFGQTPASLFEDHESKPFNPLIASVFYKRGLIETWGRGTLKILSLMREAGLAAPVLTDVNGTVTLRFELPSPESFNNGGVSGGVSGGVNGGVSGGVSGGVNDVQESILVLVQQHPGINTAGLALHLGKAQRTLERHIKQLRVSNKIIFKGAAKGGGYYLVDGI